MEMSRFFLVVGLLVAIPALALGVSGLMVRTVVGDVEGRGIVDEAAFGFDVCLSAEARLEAAAQCDLVDSAFWIIRGALAALIVGGALLIGVKIAGLISRGNRTLLLFLFKPGLLLTIGALLILVPLHATLAMAALYYGESILIGQVHFFIIAAIGFGALLGVLSLFLSIGKMFHRAKSIELARVVSREQSPRLWEFVDALAKDVGTQPPTTIIVGLKPNFYVTEADVVVPEANAQGRTMYLSLALCRIISMAELRAVLAHEYAHFTGADTRFSKKFYPIYRGLEQSLAGMAASGGDHGAQVLALLPAMGILGYYLEQFSTNEKTIGRERELRADGIAAKLVGSEELASVLVKLNATAKIWPTIRRAMAQTINEGKQFVNVSTIFDREAREIDWNAPEILAEDGPEHPTDSHPSLGQRLKNLSVDLPTVMDRAKNTDPADDPIGLFSDVDALEQDLTTLEHVVMVHLKVAVPPQRTAEEKEGAK